MVDRSELWLGRHVDVRLCGGETVGAVVDGLCNDWVGVRLDRGGYVIADWEDIEVDDDAEEVVRTEQGEVLARKSEEESVPNDLKEAADGYREMKIANGHFFKIKGTKPLCYLDDLIPAFIAGAKWQEEQGQETIELAEDHAYLAGAVNEREKMMKEAVEADVNTYSDLAAGKSWAEFVIEMPTNNLGDKVRIIIVKEDNHE